jgi:membrane carboxypeptidase/penicillin-binding protein PbpC
VRFVKDQHGNPLLDWSLPHSQPIVSAQLAYLVTHVLSDEAARWPSLGHPNPLEIGRPAATKIGKTWDGQNAWTVGYLPQLAAGVWVGTEQEGSNQVDPLIAAALWHAIIQYADQDLPARDWEIPPGVSQVDVCDPSGMLPTIYCPTVVSEVFITGNEPTQRDNLYRSFQINRETGRLATVFTPPELVEERVFLVTPPEAETWAEQAGLPTPPKDYDVIFAPLAGSPEAQIAVPAMFAYVNGEVIITGSAGGKDFNYYRLQVGQGLNPQEWIQLGSDSQKPVQNGTLAVWDTQGLDGLYAIQLLVVRNDQRVETTIVQVSIDNTPPSVQILNPSQGEITHPKEGLPMILQAKVEDDFVIDTVTFSIDGQQVASFAQAPFNLAWIPDPGKHQLKVAATDLAGNLREAATQFEVAKP